MAGTNIVVGGLYDIDRPGMPILQGRIVKIVIDSPTLPHLWVELTQHPPERNPALLVVGGGMILIPIPEPPP